MANLYILNNRVSGVLSKEVKKAIPTPKIKAVLGGDGIWCQIVYQHGGTGSEKFNNIDALEKQLQGRIWSDTRTKKGTSGFDITLDFVIYPHETFIFPRIWETSYEEITDLRKKEVWEELTQFNRFLSPGCRIRVKGQEAVYLGAHSNPYLNCTSLGNVLDKDIEILIEV